MRLFAIGFLAVAGFAVPSYAASDIDGAMQAAKKEIQERADALRADIVPTVTNIKEMSNTVDELYVLLQQKYAEGDNGGVVPTRQNTLPADFGK